MKMTVPWIPSSAVPAALALVSRSSAIRAIISIAQ